jgi:hypothetical protein
VTYCKTFVTYLQTCIVLTGRLQDTFICKPQCSCATWREEGIMELCQTLNVSCIEFLKVLVSLLVNVSQLHVIIFIISSLECV